VRLLGVGRPSRKHSLRPRKKEAYRVGPKQSICAIRSIGLFQAWFNAQQATQQISRPGRGEVGERKRDDREDQFPGHMQRFATGAAEMEPRRLGAQQLDQLRRSGQVRFVVVNQEEELARSERPCE
jgi:hypothetical protein